MAQLLQHQESAFYGKELHGCRWGLLQFFGFRRRLQSTKMLSDKKHGHEKGSGGSRRRSSYAPLKNEDSGIMDEEKNAEVTKKQKASRKNSRKSSLRSLIRRKLYGKEGQKEKMLPIAPKLLRTISIHYLETNEYVLDSEATSNVDGSSHVSILSMQDAPNKDLQHATSDTVDDSDTISLLPLKRDTCHVKRKSHRSISMDGVLHKIPYGKKVSDDVISEVLPRSASATYDQDGPKPYIGIAATAKRHANHSFRRSHSLTESLESYSQLLESIANTESKRTLTSSKSTRDRSLDVPNVMSSLPRTANAEFRSQCLTTHDEAPEDALESHDNDAEQTNIHGDKEVEVDERPCDEITTGSEKISLPEECISDRKCDVTVSTEAHISTDSSPSEAVDISEANAAICDYSAIEVDLCYTCSTPEDIGTVEQDAAIYDGDEIQSSIQTDSCIPSSGYVAVAEEHITHPEDNQMHSFQNSKPMKGTYCVPDPHQEFEADLSLNYDQETDSPMSVLDAAFSDDPASPEKYSKLDDIFLKPKILHLNDTDGSTGIGVVQENDSDDLIGLQVDPTQEDEFNYVKDIFKKSSFRNEILYDEWYSQNITALQEEDCQHYEAAAAAFDFTDMSAEQLLLFDLTNEALLDIYRKHSDCRSKLSAWFPSFDRPKPVGHPVLKDLWSKVSCHLDEQPRSTIEVDTIVSRDLARSDRWMNFQRDADNLMDSLGDFVFQKLLTQLVLELAEF